MPLASPIGSGQGLKTREQVQIIIEQATVPVVVDAGIGVPSEAAAAMELGADCCLINTAIARAADPAGMAAAMRMGVEAGRKAFLAGRMPVLPYASRQQPGGRRRPVSPFPQPCLMLVTEPSPRLPSIVADAVDGGVDAVQWRENRGKGMGYNRAYADLVAALKERAPLIVNGNWETAVGLGARRIHLPEKSLPAGVVRHRIGARSIIGKSVHSVASAEGAAKQGVDYLIAGTIFASPSHPDIAPQGLEWLREVCAAVSIPVIAIGGVTPENAGECLAAGAAGVAVLSAIMRAADPRAAAQAFREALDAAPQPPILGEQE